MSAAQQGVTQPAETLYTGVNNFLQKVEMILTRETVESFPPREWAILISQANKVHLDPRDVLMEILSKGMANSAALTNDLYKRQQAAEERKNLQTRRSHLKLVKA